MQKDRIKTALTLLPENIARMITESMGSSLHILEEVRLRTGMNIVLRAENRESLLTVSSTPELISDIVARACGYSVYAYDETLRNGYIPWKQGNRIGVCGSVCENTMQKFTSLNIRIAHEHKCLDEDDFQAFYPNGFVNTVVISSPGCGKTTLLRDIACKLSDLSGLNVAIADDRCEIAAADNGKAELYCGRRTDIMSGGRKCDSMIALLRSMSPDVIVCDEISAPEDIAATEMITNCGTKLLVSAHAKDLNDYRSRYLYKRLDEKGIFNMAIIISVKDGKRKYEPIYLK